MKLIHPDVDAKLIEKSYNCTQLIIEAPELFTKYIQELSIQINGLEGNFVLTDDTGKELEISKHIEIIIDPFSIDINGKKVTNKLYAELTRIAYNEENFLYTQNLLSAMQEYFFNLEQFSNYMLYTDTEPDISSVFKLMNVRFEETPTHLCEKINQYVKILAELFGKRIVVFVNISSYLTDNQLYELIKDLAYHEITVLMLESSQKNLSINNKKCVIIDKDGCEIC